MADNVTIEVEERVEEYIVEVQESIVTIDSELTETSTNPVKSSGIWTWVKGLFTTHTTEADAHPASAISVDASEFEGNLDETVDTVQKLATAVDELEASQVITEPLTPSNDAVAVGDGFQEIAEKVAGLKELTYRKLYEIEITDPVAFIDITKDLEGNDLDLRVGFRVSYYLLADADALYISGIQINGITDEVYEFSSLGRNYLVYYGTRFGSSGGIHLTLNGKNPDITFHYRGEYGTSQPGTITGINGSQRIRQNIESITSFRLLTDGFLAGSKIVIYGA